MPLKTLSEFQGFAVDLTGATPGPFFNTSFALTGDIYLWIGPVSGDWTIPGNWRDVTSGANPAPNVPAAGDIVTFNSPTNLFQVISGTGASASLTLTGQNDVVGNLTTGALNVGKTSPAVVNGTLRVSSGGTLSAATLTIGATSIVTLAGGTLAISGSVADGPVIAANNATLTVGGSLGAAVQASNHTIARAGSVTIVNGGGFSADATSSIEVGTVGGAANGALTVDPGATFDFNVSTSLLSRGATAVFGNVINNGTMTFSGVAPAYLTAGAVNVLFGINTSGSGKIVIQDGATLATPGPVTGTLGFQIGKSATLNTFSVGASDSIAFNGPGGVLALSGAVTVDPVTQAQTTTYDMKAPISGFNASDAITLNSVVTGAVLSGGVLTLSNGATTVATLNLTGNYAGRTFSAIPTSKTATEIVLTAAVAAGPSTGTAAGDGYVWNGGLSGDWNTAASWTDTTLPANPAPVAPGVKDSVTFNGPSTDGNLKSIYDGTFIYQIIGGTGNSANLTLNGANDVLGALTTTNLSVGVPFVGGGTAAGVRSQLRIGTGGKVTAANVSFEAASSIFVAGGTLTVSGAIGPGNGVTLATGTLTVGGAFNGSLVASVNSHAQAGSVVNAGFFALDATSSIEIGTLGSAVNGAVTVDAGATVSGSSDFFAGIKVIDNGVVTITSTSRPPISSGNVISGSGKIILGDGGAQFLAGDATFSAGTLGLQIGRNDVLTVGQVGLGNTIAFNATGGALNISKSAVTRTYNMQASISGFDASDVITIASPVTSAVLNSGVLTLTNNGAAVTTLKLAGNYTGKSFLAVPVSGSLTEILLNQPAAPGPGAGTATGDAYVWNGPLSGDWNTAANWNDTTLNTNPAAIAPGAKDSVTFNSSTSLYQVINGVGNSANLTLSGFNDVIGALTTGVLTVATPNGSTVGGTARIGTGGTINASSVIEDNAFISVAGGTLAVTGAVSAGLSQIGVDSGVFTVGGTLGGGVSATNSAVVKAASVNLTSGQGFTTDATSKIEIGTVGGTAAGAVTVDAGATYGFTPMASFQNFLAVGGSLIDNGTITVGGTLAVGSPSAPTLLANPAGFNVISPSYVTVSGTGKIIVQNGANLSAGIGTALAGTLSLQIGAGSSLTLDKAAATDTVTFVGTGGALNIVTPQQFSGGKFGYPYSMAAAIAGFDASDAITINNPITNATFNAGVLSLSNAGNTISTTLNLTGNYAGQTFLALPVSATTTQISLFAGTVFVAGTTITVGALAGGTASLDTLFADTNIITNKTVTTLVINGPGTVSLNGAVTIHNLFVSGGGTFILNGAVVTTDPVTVDAQGNITGFGKLIGAITDTGAITASGGTLDLTDAISGPGTLNMAAGASLQLDAAVTTTGGLNFTGLNETLILGSAATISTTINGFGAGDTIKLNGQQIVASEYNTGTHVLTIHGADTIARTLTLAGNYTAAMLTPKAGVISQPACFAAGTPILTTRGEVAVEDLIEGDEVVTWSGGTSPVRWIGRRRVDCARHPSSRDLMPVRVRQSAFGDAMPARDLFLSPDHAIYIPEQDVLIPVKYLIDGDMITQIDVSEVTYFHVELAAHDVLLAAGLPTESFLPGWDRGWFENADGPIRLFQDFTARPHEAMGYARLAIMGADVAAVRSRVARVRLEHAA